jgi:uncharacterized protein involved in exopolysaccharide biosynthesis
MFRDWLLAPVISLLRSIRMDNAALSTALDGVSTQLGAVGDQLTKAMGEIQAEIVNGFQTTPAVDAALAKLQTLAATLATASQALDDLNPDAPPTGGTGTTT